MQADPHAQSADIAGSDGRASRMEPEGLSALRQIASAVGIEFEPHRADQALRQATRDIPDGSPDGQFARLSRAAEDLGIRLSTFRRPLSDVLGLAMPGTPLVALSRTDRGAEWLVLTTTRGRKVCVANGTGERAGRWLTLDELVRVMGAESELSPSTWGVAQLSLPYGDEGADPALGHHAPLIQGSPNRRLWKLLRFDRRDLWIVVALALAIGGMMLATPLAVQQLVNFVAFGVLLTPLVVLSVILFSFLAIGAVLRGTQTYLVEILQQRLFVRVVADLSWRLPRVRVESFDRQHGPELVNRFFDVLTVQKTGATLLLDGVSIILIALMGLVVLAFYHPLLLAFDVALLSVIAIIVFVLGRGAVSSAVRESFAKYAVAAWLEEMARHPLAFKHAGAPTLALERADGLARRWLRARRDHYRALFRQIIGTLVLQVAASTALLGIGGWLVIAGQLTLGQLVAAELIVTVIVTSVSKLGKAFENYYDLLAASEKLGHLIDLPLERDGGQRIPESGRGAKVEFQSLGFSYDSDHVVFQDMSAVIGPGQRVAVMGPNGSGKSTLVDLLFGLRQPTSGRILIDGWDIRDLRLETVRGLIGTVKRLEIVEATIAENVHMGRHDVGPADVLEALATAQLLDVVRSLPDGLNTRLATGGAPLSSGQAQRLMLARAIAGKPRLLVLDEAIDEIDVDIRESVIASLFSRSSPWTLIMLTHDVDLARRCDSVIRLKEGRATQIDPEGLREDSR